MKKILITLSSVLFLAACTQFEKETTPEYTANPVAPTIEEAALPEGYDEDHAFAVKITPGSENIYYSYAIIAGAPEVDPSTLLKNGYSKNAVVVKLVIEEVNVDVPLSGVFESASVKDTTVVAFNLTPNTPYTVYAVGSGEKGVISTLAQKTFTTGDHTSPSAYTEDEEGNRKYSFSAAGLEEGTIVIDFGDPIELTEGALAGTKKFHALYQTPNVYDENGKKVHTISTSQGEVVAYSETFYILKKGSWYYTCTPKGKKLHTFSTSNVGEVLTATGDTFTSRKGSWIFTWDKNGKKLNTRPARQ